MATTFSLTSTYAGEAATGYISKALLSNKTIEKGYVTTYTDIKKSLAVQRIDLSNIIQAYSDAFTATGTLTIDERILNPVRLKSNVQFGKNALLNHWSAAQNAPGANNNGIPSDMREYIIDYFGKLVCDGIERVIWKGDTAGSTGTILDEVDGLVKTISGASGKISVTADVAGLSASNIVTELSSVYDAIPAEIRESDSIKIFVPYAAAGYYKQASGTKSNEKYFVGARELNFLGIEIVPVPMANDTMIAAQTGNLFVGTDLVSDFNEVKLLDLSETTGDNYLRFAMQYVLGCQIGEPTEIVLYA